MSPDAARQWSSAALSGLGIVSLTVLAAVRQDVQIVMVLPAIVALATRFGALATVALAPAAEPPKEK
jgi:hypothetical protein